MNRRASCSAIFAAIFAAVAVSISACAGFDLSVGYDASPAANFDYFWRLFDENYASFAEKGVDWDAVRSEREPLVDEGMSEDELFDLLASMIYELDDPHVSLRNPTRFANSARSSELRTQFREATTGAYLEGASLRGGGRFVTGRIAGRPELAYVRIKNFSPGGGAGSMMANHSEWAEDIDPIMAAFADAAGLIVDLRDNRGGLMQDVAYIAGRFYAEDEVYAVTREKTGPGREDFGSPYELRIAAGGTRAPEVPLVVLTNRLTTSAGEFMAMALLRLPGARQVGTRTAGGFSFRTLHELPNGWTCTVSTQRVRTSEGLSYEGAGIVPPPGFVVQNTEEAAAQGRDPQLEAALVLFAGE